MQEEIDDKKKLRNPFYLDEKVLVLAERLKKKDAKFFKSSTDNIPLIEKKYLQFIKGQNLIMEIIYIG